MGNENLNIVRETALKTIEKSERNYKLAFLTAALIECAFFVLFLLLADLRNRSHLLLFISALAIYFIISCGLFALAAHINKGIGRVLQAIEMLAVDKK